MLVTENGELHIYLNNLYDSEPEEKLNILLLPYGGTCSDFF